MSAIFPTTPVNVNLHHLPSSAEFISYGVSEGSLHLKAWMPANQFQMKIRNSETMQHDNFHNNHCRECPRNRSDFYRENCEDYFSSSYYLEFKSDEARDKLYEQECCVYFRGFRGQTCNEGHEFNVGPENDELDVQNMVYQINLSILGDSPRFKKVSDTAHLRAGYVDDTTGEIFATRGFSAPNVYSSMGEFWRGNICWGNSGHRSNTSPDSLRNISVLYSSTNANNDLLSLSAFLNNNSQLIDCVKANSFTELSGDNFLCSGYDSLMLIDADKDVQAFFTMIMAGFKSLPEAPHIMIIPLKNCTIEREGDVYFGYSTQEDGVGRCWYVSSEGYLIGQLDSSYSFV